MKTATKTQTGTPVQGASAGTEIAREHNIRRADRAKKIALMFKDNNPFAAGAKALNDDVNRMEDELNRKRTQLMRILGSYSAPE